MVQLAELIGSKHSTISSWESGGSEPGPKYLHKLNEVFDVNLIQLMNINDNYDIVKEQQQTYNTKNIVENKDKLIDSIYELIKNNEKLINNNTKLVDTNTMLSKYVLQLKKNVEMA